MEQLREALHQSSRGRQGVMLGKLTTEDRRKKIQGPCESVVTSISNFNYRKVTGEIAASSGSGSTVPVTAEDQPSTSADVMMTSHVDDAPSDVVTNTVTMVSVTPVSPREDCLENITEHDDTMVTSNNAGSEQQDMLSVAMFPSPSSKPAALDNDISSAEVLQLLEEESPTPVLQQQDVPMCCSTPDKMECGSLDTRCTSTSPSIPLQNTSAKMVKVDATPVVLPHRRVALEGLYEDSTDSDHSHDSLDLFDDQVIRTSQSKDDQNLTDISPALFTDDQQPSMPLYHVDNATPSLSTSALGDSISTQVSMTVCVCVSV